MRVACGDGRADLWAYGGNYPVAADGPVPLLPDRESQKGQLLSGAVLFL